MFLLAFFIPIYAIEKKSKQNHLCHSRALRCVGVMMIVVVVVDVRLLVDP